MADYFIDITSDFCPITFVKTKLTIEKIRHGDRLEVRLKGTEPLNNVPRSVTELGHLLLAITREAREPPDGVYRILIEKVDHSGLAINKASVSAA
jgi:TusA-related sulfurtransferase